ncbi:MAG TPA: META domain-containing protein [Hanamia sp.]|nr:META domain-containing protein [Hanamia sp.]
MKLIFKCLTAISTIAFVAGCNTSKKSAGDNTEVMTRTPLRGIYWRLTTLLGQPIIETTKSREAFLNFSPDGKSVGGNGGCNAFRGSYDVTDSSHLSFGPIMSTKMYCEDAKFENTFFKILDRTDNYLISGDTLFLRNAEMDSTAKFVADYFKK